MTPIQIAALALFISQAGLIVTFIILRRRTAKVQRDLSRLRLLQVCATPSCSAIRRRG